MLAVAGSYLLLAMLEGQIIQPLFVGRRLKINPLLIFLALWFGGLFWGIAGVILATPALLTLKVIAEHSIGALFMSALPSPSPSTPYAPHVPGINCNGPCAPEPDPFMMGPFLRPVSVK